MEGTAMTRSFAVEAVAARRDGSPWHRPSLSAEQYRIAVSNSYIGNEWRVEMINFMQAYAAKNLKGKVDAHGQQFRHRRAEADRGRSPT